MTIQSIEFFINEFATIDKEIFSQKEAISSEKNRNIQLKISEFFSKNNSQLIRKASPEQALAIGYQLNKLQELIFTTFPPKISRKIEHVIRNFSRKSLPLSNLEKDMQITIFSKLPLEEVYRLALQMQKLENNSISRNLFTHLVSRINTNRIPLKELGIKKASSLVSFIRTVKELGQSLNSLNLNGIRGLKDDHLIEIATLKELEYLSFFGCPRITNRGLASLKNLIHLKELHFHGNRKISDKGLLCIQSLKQLRKLSFRYCLSLTDACIPKISTLKDLECLDLSGCNFGGTSLALLKELSHLKELLLRECSKIEKNDVAVLEELKGLNIIL